jgi:sulfite dehydrogenase (quinone) subunit SoeC
MHPAYSVLFFTTMSGAGYGLLIWLSIAMIAGGISAGEWHGFVMLGLGLVLVTIGLLASTLHLGRPERAIKAFSQWRTSWLSREGVAAVATYVPAVLIGLLWFSIDPSSAAFSALAVLLVAGCLVTVWCTGMIYASLRTIRAWAHPLVAPGYMLLAMATGGVLFIAIRYLSGVSDSTAILFALAALLAGWALKSSYWSAIDGAEKTLKPADAIGLTGMGKVRVLEPAHTQPNFVMREMGYEIARKHAERLRRVSIAALFVVPIVALLLMLVVPPALATLLAIVAVLSAAIGVFSERWLFFAEAQHVVMLYYGAESA